jgi:hypothetical protein
LVIDLPPFPLGDYRFTYLVAFKFTFDIVFEIAVTLLLVGNHGSELFREFFKVVEVVDAKTRARSLGRVSWANTLTSSSDASTAKFDFLQAINSLMEVKNKMGSVRDEKTTISVETYDGETIRC